MFRRYIQWKLGSAICCINYNQILLQIKYRDLVCSKCFISITNKICCSQAVGIKLFLMLFQFLKKLFCRTSTGNRVIPTVVSLTNKFSCIKSTGNQVIPTGVSITTKFSCKISTKIRLFHISFSYYLFLCRTNTLN